MARLGELFDAIETRLTAMLGARGTKIPTFGRTLADAAKFKSPPSVTMVPTSGRASVPAIKGGNPEPLWNRGLVVQARVYERDVDGCNELAERLVEAVDELYAGNYSVEGEEWDTAGLLGGMVMIVIFRFSVRFERTPLKIVQPQEMFIEQEIVSEVA